jgi:hypothetical protein
MVHLIECTQIKFTTRSGLCPQVHINNNPFPNKSEMKYLGLHLDQNLTWKTTKIQESPTRTQTVKCVLADE